MKVIPVVGYSKSGKTSFIRKLIVALKPRGNVGVIKHLGRHPYKLEKNKDTTIFFEEGAAISAGIDDIKTALIMRNPHLEYLLAMFADAGVQFAVIEGFKSIHFPKIVIGNLEAEGCVLKNPEVEEVLKSLDKFGDYHTMGGIVKELKREGDLSRAGAILTFTGLVRQWTGDKKTEFLDFDNSADRNSMDLKRKLEAIGGILGAKIYHRSGRLFAGEDITYIAVLAEHRRIALQAMSETFDELKRGLVVK